jgi:hypothetical protein
LQLNIFRFTISASIMKRPIRFQNWTVKLNGKAIHVTAYLPLGSWDVETSMLCTQSQMAVRLSALRINRALPSRTIPDTHFC